VVHETKLQAAATAGAGVALEAVKRDSGASATSDGCTTGVEAAAVVALVWAAAAARAAGIGSGSSETGPS